MKKLVLSILTAGMLLSACNQSAKTTKTADSAATQPAEAGSTAASAGSMVVNAPVMKFDNASHDFGKISQGDKVSYKFNFTNSGKSPLIISNAVASCGCTTPNWPKAPIKPGDSAQILVVFNSTGKAGLQDKMITITANTTPPQNVVHLVGEVLVKK
jgi:Protein of unknown function (DUF1573)